MKKVRKAVIPVAGYGTRFLPYTKAVPKAMLPIVNIPAVQHVIEEAVQSGIEEVILIIGQHREIIENHFSKAEELEGVLKAKGEKGEEFLKSILYPETMANIKYIIQDEQLGTGHAVLLAQKYIGDDEPFAVMFGDDVMKNQVPVLKQLIDAYQREDKTVVGVKNVGYENVCKYAAVEYDKKDGNTYHVTKITEKPKMGEAKSELAPLGRYVLKEGFFNILRNLKPSLNGEYQFTDGLDIAINDGGLVALEFEGTRYDMGDLFGFLKANIEYSLEYPSLKEKMKEYIKDLASKF